METNFKLSCGNFEWDLRKIGVKFMEVLSEIYRTPD